MGGIIAGLALAVAGVLFLLTRGSEIRMPDSIAGAQRISSPEVEQFEQMIQRAAQEDGVPVEAAVYSDETGHPFFLVAAEDRSVLTAEDALHEFVRGAEATNPDVVVRLSRMSSERRGDVAFACAPIRRGLAGAVCSWKDPVSVGFVLGVERSPAQTLELTVASQQALRA